jgi:VIT1/CCC1 family predicted Fe2+/Mn2+ transporter
MSQDQSLSADHPQCGRTRKAVLAVCVQPIQAAFASAATFAVGAALPLLIAALVPLSSLVLAVSLSTIVFLALLGAAGARTGGAKMGAAVLRVVFWGALAMGVTTLIGKLTGTVV